MINDAKKWSPVIIAFAMIITFSSCKKDNASASNGKLIVFTDNQQFVYENYSYQGVIGIDITVDSNSAYTYTLAGNISSINGYGNEFPQDDACSTTTSSAIAVFIGNLNPGLHTLHTSYNYYQYSGGTVTTPLTNTMTFQIDAGNCTYIDLPAYQ